MGSLITKSSFQLNKRPQLVKNMPKKQFHLTLKISLIILLKHLNFINITCSGVVLISECEKNYPHFLSHLNPGKISRFTYTFSVVAFLPSIIFVMCLYLSFWLFFLRFPNPYATFMHFENIAQFFLRKIPSKHALIGTWEKV